MNETATVVLIHRASADVSDLKRLAERMTTSRYHYLIGVDDRARNPAVSCPAAWYG